MKIKLGRKSEPCICEPEKSVEPRLNYPSMYINDTKLPLTGEDIGSIMTAVVQLKITGLNTRSTLKKDSINYDFEVHSIEFKTESK
jgi:hypothetical protein